MNGRGREEGGEKMRLRDLMAHSRVRREKEGKSNSGVSPEVIWPFSPTLGDLIRTRAG